LSPSRTDGSSEVQALAGLCSGVNAAYWHDPP
jgi:hypothetical protein